MANDDELRAALLALGDVGVKTAIAELRAQGHEVDSKTIRELRATMPTVEAEPVVPAGKRTTPIVRTPGVRATCQVPMLDVLDRDRVLGRSLPFSRRPRSSR